MLTNGDIKSLQLIQRFKLRFWLGCTTQNGLAGLFNIVFYLIIKLTLGCDRLNDRQGLNRFIVFEQTKARHQQHCNTDIHPLHHH
jgi:hypothetical protein